MSNKAVIGIIVALAVIGGFAWWSLGDNGGGGPLPGQGEEPEQPINEELVVNHYFDNGKHTIEGTMTLPTPCHSLTHEVVIAESMPEQVTINFYSNPGEGICTQVLADKFFRVTFDASENAKISATFNGMLLNLIFSETKSGITK